MAKLAISEIKNPNWTWIDVAKTGREELDFLRERFNFLEIDLQDCTPPFERAKAVTRPNYIFMVLIFPVFNPKTGETRPAEVDFFIGKDFLVTVHLQKLTPLTVAWTQANKNAKLKHPVDSVATLLHLILDELIDTSFPVLTTIANKIEQIEKVMGNVHNREAIYQIFKIKISIVNIRKAVQPHKRTIRKLMAATPSPFTAREMHYFEHLVDHAKEVWDQLESEADTINAIEDTHLSLLDFRTNDIMRILTIFAVIVFPLNLLAAIFGMNTIHTPILGRSLDFWIIVLLMFVGSIVMIGIFKKKRWF